MRRLRIRPVINLLTYIFSTVRDPLTATSMWEFTPYWNPKDIRALQAELKTLEEKMKKKSLTEKMKAKKREKLRDEKEGYQWERERVSLFTMLLPFLNLPLQILKI